MPSFGEPIDDLMKIRIDDNGEELVMVSELCSDIRFAVDHPKFPGRPRTCLARRSVAQMLCEAQQLLPEGLFIEIQDAYRSDESQRELFRLMCEEFKAVHPEWTESELLEHTNDFVASPYIDIPPPHSTGGAVDITLVDRDGNRLDMTSPYNWDEASAPTNYPGLSDTARSNRHILITCMSKAGFSNYMGEWWHWSYGDSAWALRSGLDTAIYGKASPPQR